MSTDTEKTEETSADKQPGGGLVFAPNPERYARLALPVSVEDATFKLKELGARLEALRTELGIAELVCIAGCYSAPDRLHMSISSFGSQERGVDMAVELTRSLARGLAEVHQKRADSLTELAGVSP